MRGHRHSVFLGAQGASWGRCACAAWVAMLAVLPARSVDAQNCETDPGGIYQTFPASGSRGVPRNGLVVVTYCPTDEPLVDHDSVRLLRDVGAALEGCRCSAAQECLPVGGEDRCLEETATARSVTDGVVRLETRAHLDEHATYVIEAPEPTGVARLAFTTGTTIDTSPPVFSGLVDVRIRGCGGGYASNAACPQDQEDEGFVVVLQALAASDDVGLVNLEYAAYQVRDQDEVERGTTRGDGADDVSMTVFIPADDLTDDEWERLCFAMTARDFFGHETPPDITPEVTVCHVTPEYSPFGSLCCVSPGRGSADAGAAWLGLALAALLWRRRATAS